VRGIQIGGEPSRTSRDRLAKMAREIQRGIAFLRRSQENILRAFGFLQDAGFRLQDAQVGREAWVRFRSDTKEIVLVHEPWDLPYLTITKLHAARNKSEMLKLPKTIKDGVAAKTFRRQRDAGPAARFLRSLDDGAHDDLINTVIAHYASRLSETLENPDQ
jgi:hypothetical protein